MDSSASARLYRAYGRNDAQHKGRSAFPGTVLASVFWALGAVFAVFLVVE